MIRKACIALGVILGVLLTTAPGSAQTALATLRGAVLDQQGGALPGVTVTAKQVDTNTDQTDVTGTEGQYFLPNLRPGSYEVTSELHELHVAPADAGSSGRSGSDGQRHDAPGRMSPRPSRSSGGASPSRRRVRWRRSSPTNKSTICPPSRRNFSALATLAPGATTSTATGTGQGTGVSISGQRPFTNGIVVDGASNQMQFYGRQANDFPQDWIQEFQVLTNAFTAEFGQAAGGDAERDHAQRRRISTNGRGYGFFRDEAFDAPPFAGRYDANRNPVFLDETPPFDQQRFGGYVGGPIREESGSSTSAASSGCSSNSSDVLGISDYWRQFVTDTIIPTGQRSTVGLVKVDLNVNTTTTAATSATPTRTGAT